MDSCSKDAKFKFSRNPFRWHASLIVSNWHPWLGGLRHNDSFGTGQIVMKMCAVIAHSLLTLLITVLKPNSGENANIQPLQLAKLQDHKYIPTTCTRRHLQWIRQIKRQLDATLCRFYFCRVILHVSGVKRPSSGELKHWHGGPWYRCYSCR